MPNPYRIIKTSDDLHLGHVIDLDDTSHAMPNGFVFSPENTMNYNGNKKRLSNTNYIVDVEPA